MHTAGAVMCVLCHPFDAVHAHSAMVDDSLYCHYDVYHAGVRPKDSTIKLHDVRAVSIRHQTNRLICTLHSSL